MIGAENARAIEVGLEGLAMAVELGISELRAHALDSIGLARARIGDPRGIENLEESIAIAVADNSLESVRGYNNLGNALVEAGDLGRAFELYEAGRAAAGRFGDVDRIRWFEAERVYECYWRGHWDEAVGFPTAFEQDARLVRGRVRLARDDVDAALADSTRALELGRRAGYPEMLVPALALQARILEAVGEREEAESHSDELLAVWPEHCPTSYWLADLAFAVAAIGRPRRLLQALADARAPSRWLAAARAVAAGDHTRAAEAYRTIGSLPDELRSRLELARAAAGAGRRTEAETVVADLRPALERIGARRDLRDGERLLAALARSSA
jgi:tetratricopeptide (TPR) repeat protein